MNSKVFRAQFEIPTGSPNAGEVRSFRVEVIEARADDEGRVAWLRCKCGTRQDRQFEWYTRDTVDAWYASRVDIDSMETVPLQTWVDELD